MGKISFILKILKTLSIITYSLVLCKHIMQISQPVMTILKTRDGMITSVTSVLNIGDVGTFSLTVRPSLSLPTCAVRDTTGALMRVDSIGRIRHFLSPSFFVGSSGGRQSYRSN